MKNVTRRNFIKTSLLASVPLALNGFPLYAYAKPRVNFFDEDNDKILVLVQLQGGNDGLNTLFHAGQYSNLNAVRGNILVPSNSILTFSGGYGLHPSMQGLKDIWDTERLCVIQDVGYPNQNRSHFRSTDIWHAASSAEDYVSTGWIGRFFDQNYSDYPLGYPNNEHPHPFALTMGKVISETCQGINSNYSMSLIDPFNPGTALISAAGDIPSNCYGDVLQYVNETIGQTNAYAEVISEAANSGNNLSPKYIGLTSSLSRQLKNVARLISGGLQTKIYIVQIGGFDTHDNQVVAGATTTGNHSNLLKQLSDAICAFQDDLQLLGVSDRVIGMTYSEFGRRIRSTAGFGTDHGTAAPMFLFGSCANNQVLGEAYDIDPQVGIEDGVPMQFDFRNVYGTILSHWLGASEADVKNIIFQEFQALPIFKQGCLPPACPPAAVITGDSEVCEDGTNTYSVPSLAGANFQWEVVGGTILAGQGTNTITVKWENGTAGSVKVIQTTQ